MGHPLQNIHPSQLRAMVSRGLKMTSMASHPPRLPWLLNRPSLMPPQPNSTMPRRIWTPCRYHAGHFRQLCFSHWSVNLSNHLANTVSGLSWDGLLGGSRDRGAHGVRLRSWRAWICRLCRAKGAVSFEGRIIETSISGRFHRAGPRVQGVSAWRPLQDASPPRERNWSEVLVLNQKNQSSVSLWSIFISNFGWCWYISSLRVSEVCRVWMGSQELKADKWGSQTFVQKSNQWDN